MLKIMPWLKPSISSGAAVYKGTANDDIYTAFKEIAGIRTLPSTGSPMYQTIKGKTSLSGQPGYIIRVPQQDGSTVVKEFLFIPICFKSEIYN